MADTAGSVTVCPDDAYENLSQQYLAQLAIAMRETFVTIAMSVTQTNATRINPLLDTTRYFRRNENKFNGNQAIYSYPIVALRGSPNFRVSKWAASKLQFLTQRCMTSMKSAAKLLRKINGTKISEKDGTSLFTSIQKTP